jgi:hypothetical protein
VKFNRGGLICVGFYASYVLFMLAAAYLARDSKTSGFFMALSALPGWLVVGAMPEATMEWLLLNGYFFVQVGVYLLSLAAAYLFGWILEKAVLGVAPTLNRIDHWWFDRVRGDDR